MWPVCLIKIEYLVNIKLFGLIARWKSSQSKRQWLHSQFNHRCCLTEYPFYWQGEGGIFNTDVLNSDHPGL